MIKSTYNGYCFCRIINEIKPLGQVIVHKNVSHVPRSFFSFVHIPLNAACSLVEVGLVTMATDFFFSSTYQPSDISLIFQKLKRVADLAADCFCENLSTSGPRFRNSVYSECCWGNGAVTTGRSQASASCFSKMKHANCSVGRCWCFRGQGFNDVYCPALK